MYLTVFFIVEQDIQTVRDGESHGLNSGHYTATIVSNEDQTWYEFDDAHVKKVRINLTHTSVWHIFKTYKRNQILNAYLLNVPLVFVEWCRLKSNHLQKPGLTSMFSKFHFIKSDIVDKTILPQGPFSSCAELLIISHNLHQQSLPRFHGIVEVPFSEHFKDFLLSWHKREVLKIAEKIMWYDQKIVVVVRLFCQQLFQDQECIKSELYSIIYLEIIVALCKND